MIDAPSPAPKPLWLIALIGLIPFPAGALTYVFGPADLAGPAMSLLVTWCAIVLGFLGGVRWGLETGRPEPRWHRLAATTISPVAAWLLIYARGALENAWILGGFLAAFMLQWLFDHAAPDVPSRYPRLMTSLTLVACLSLALALEQALRM